MSLSTKYVDINQTHKYLFQKYDIFLINFIFEEWFFSDFFLGSNTQTGSLRGFRKTRNSTNVNKHFLQDDKQIWDFFEPYFNSDYQAVCIFCNKQISLGKIQFGKGPGTSSMIYHTQSRHPQEFNILPIATSYETPRAKKSIMPQQSYSEPRIRSILYR